MRYPYLLPHERGPTLYILLFGFGWPFLAGYLVIPSFPVTFLIPLLGFPIGGLVYRTVSNDWPNDDTALKRMIFFACLVMLLFVGVPMAAIQEIEALIVFGPFATAICAGIFLAGTRRSLE